MYFMEDFVEPLLLYFQKKVFKEVFQFKNLWK